ncbi:MAG: HAMP domain-containing histidine kinase [Betaproteobacteria bacterium]|nr:HAMP domain-containing histidine kinase [Betaproteobacteria bacterium]
MWYAASRFRLTRYFTIASLIAFTVVGLALFVLERQEEVFFEQVQAEQTTFFSKVQLELSGQQEDKARSELLAVHEAGHENLTRFLANVLWEKNIAPFMAKVQRIPDGQCRSMADTPGTEPTVEVNARHACFAEVGRRIMELPAFSSLDATAYAAMRSSTVFKIKVFDLRGITVYSSEHTQVGEDKSENLGWKTAVAGKPASELTHRDKFSAFEGVVENRDLISSYVPVRSPGGDRVIGVFEIYSDVTPFLDQINITSARIREITAANQAKVERAARDNEQKVHSSSQNFLAIVGGLLALLYAVLLFLVRNGQRILDQQSRAQEQATHREQLWHREKMAALSTMAKHVSHELGNPLATIAGLAEEIAGRQGNGGGGANQPKLILEQTQRIGAMIRQIADFAAARSEKPELADINQMVAAIRDFLSFDGRFQATRIEFRPDLQLPACVVIPDSLNEVLMDLMQACVEGNAKPERILVETRVDGAGVQIRIACEPASAALNLLFTESGETMRFESAKRRVAAMGGQLVLDATGLWIALPVG